MKKEYFSPALELFEIQTNEFCSESVSSADDGGYAVIDSVKDQMPD